MYTDASNINRNKVIAKFLADSGATEYLTNSKIIFKSFDNTRHGMIKCANKNESADLITEGEGRVELRLENGKLLEIENVIFAGELKKNFLSLRKFAELGLAIYLDNEKINIFDPNSNKTFISDVYKKLYWIIELEINKSSSKIINRQVFANLINIEPQVRRYFTRSTAIKEKEMTDEKNEIEEGKRTRE